jgi:hypothetical protein
MNIIQMLKFWVLSINSLQLIRITAFVIGLSAVTNCSTKENRKLLFQKDTKDYKCSLYSIDKKYDKNGKSQCANYSRSSWKSGLYTSYGLSMKGLLASVLQTNIKYIDVDLDSLDIPKYLVFDYHNYSKSVDVVVHDTMLINCLYEALDIEIQKENRRVNGYDLIVLDTNVLSNYQTNDSLAKITYEENMMHFEAMNLTSIAQLFDGFSSYYIVSKSDLINTYNIEISHSTDIEELNKSLNMYGLGLIPTTVNRVFFRVIQKHNHHNTPSKNLIHK